jgi:hypothetical protein
MEAPVDVIPRRWHHISLRTTLVVISLICVGLGLYRWAENSRTGPDRDYRSLVGSIAAARCIFDHATKDPNPPIISDAAVIELNPVKIGLPRQHWDFVTPYDGWLPGQITRANPQARDRPNSQRKNPREQR